jgi:transposase
MEAHHLGRLFAAQGHSIRLMSPENVWPYVKAQKTYDRDAEGIAEAATRPTMRFVEMKIEDQLDMQTPHRSRERLVGERTAISCAQSFWNAALSFHRASASSNNTWSS